MDGYEFEIVILIIMKFFICVFKANIYIINDTMEIQSCKEMEFQSADASHGTP